MSNEFQMGVLTKAIDSLEKTVGDLTAEVSGLRREVGEIKLFRAKVVGMAVSASAFVSFCFAAATEAWRAWAR